MKPKNGKVIRAQNMSRALSRSLRVLFNLHSTSYEVDFIAPILQMKKIKAWGYARITAIHTVSKGVEPEWNPHSQSGAASL